jgi:hypothetical protein
VKTGEPRVSIGACRLHLCVQHLSNYSRDDLQLNQVDRTPPIVSLMIYRCSVGSTALKCH